ncbi:hypothetical protein HRbin13_01392 [bacterium HR13]|nr:hypothetical protein HRbin13_01392 [bacterium HR13]
MWEAPSGIPGCPDLALSTWSTLRNRIVFMTVSSLLMPASNILLRCNRYDFGVFFVKFCEIFASIGYPVASVYVEMSA